MGNEIRVVFVEALAHCRMGGDFKEEDDRVC